eukprot:TRINITY_DN110950_c0_g1_i1.p1 TRINITY_DN110950_c0_g1~~TRINITY_DN110950_c0_g1_i1.p1  ORF type:complete len:246 (-),score=63.18 TRINITY_DN110950_c0_g1_i1:12-749(-)
MAVHFEFFFDCLSPFSYFAFQVVRRYKKLWDLDLRLRPTLLGGVMAATKNVPPGARPWAAATAFEGAQHLARNKQWFNVPSMQPMPSNFFGPQGPADPNGLARDFRCMRLLTAVELRHPEALEACAAAFFDMYWTDPRDAEGRVVITEELLAAVCVRAGIAAGDAQDLVAAIQAEPTKAALKQSVKDCVDAGGYGLPYYRITKHGQSDQPEVMVAFGSDRFEQLAFAMKKPWHGPDPDQPWQAKL